MFIFTISEENGNYRTQYVAEEKSLDEALIRFIEYEGYDDAVDVNLVNRMIFSIDNKKDMVKIANIILASFSPTIKIVSVYEVKDKIF